MVKNFKSSKRRNDRVPVEFVDILDVAEQSVELQVSYQRVGIVPPINQIAL